MSKAISPEGIINWQVWDGANKRWEKAPELQAISVGSRRIAFTGATLPLPLPLTLTLTLTLTLYPNRTPHPLL